MDKKLTKHFLKQGSSGFVHKIDSRDLLLNTDVLGAAPVEIKPLGRLEKILESPLAKPENIIYQGQILSCVTCSAAFLNFYNSWFNDQNEAFQSWLSLYSQVPHYGGGTSINEVLSQAKNVGLVLDEHLPSRIAVQKGEKYAQNKALMTQELKEMAMDFQIDSYLATGLSRQELYQVLQYTPLLIGIYVGTNFGKGINYPATGKSFGHACVLIDVTKEGDWLAVNWWEDGILDVRTLHKSYPIIAGKIIKDKKDTFFISKKEQNMKFIKRENEPEICLIDTEGRKDYIGPGMASLYKFGKNADKNLEIVTQEGWDSYPNGPSFDVRADNLWSVAEFLVKSKYPENFGLAIQKVMEAVERGEDPNNLLK